MISLLKDYRIGFDPETGLYLVEANIGGVKIVFMANESKLSGLAQVINIAIKQEKEYGNGKQ